VNPFHRRIDRLENIVHPEPEADVSRLSDDERAQLEAVLRHMPDGDLAVLTDDDLALLKELQRRAWVY
jgi:hypothetical protein